VANIHTWLNRVFTAQVVTFAAGVITSILVRAIFGNFITLSEGLIAILTVVLAVFAISVIVSLRQDIITKLAQSRLSTHVYHALKTPNGDVPLYDPVIQSISLANESIRVISLFRPPDMEVSLGRQRYYQKIEDILEEKRQKGVRFRYERIVQVKEVRHGKLYPSQTDRITYQHCKHLLELQKKQTSLTIHLRQIPDILGSLSFIIVDDYEIVFAIPTITQNNYDELKATQLGTGITFTDPDGTMVKEMLNLFDDLRLGADPVLSVADESEVAR
jgi:hypothetical protein